MKEGAKNIDGLATAGLATTGLATNGLATNIFVQEPADDKA